MKNLTIEFRVTKEICKNTYGIPTDLDSFLELLSDAEISGEQMKWKIGTEDITFFINDQEIGNIYIWEEEE